MSDWYWRRGDTLPFLRRQLALSDGTPINLLGASVSFWFGPAGGLSRRQRAIGSVSIIDAATGIVEFQPHTDDTDVVGNFKGEFECILSGKRLTVPNGIDPETGEDDYFLFRVTQDLGDA